MAYDSSSSESSSTSMDHILESGSRITTNNSKQLHKRSKPTYQIRKLKNRGALLVLVWNYLVVSLFYYVTVHTAHVTQHYITLGITLPIAGWLADVYFGRYKVIHWSMWIMWIGSMLATISSIIVQMVDGYDTMNKRWVIERALQAIATIGYGGYQANIIQFGIDQLHDASTSEIQTFISWYVWSYLSGGIALELATTCMPKEYHIFGKLLITASLTIVLCLALIFDNILVKEPITQNPFKLVYEVIKFAIQNKHPRCRSAFTYWEDELPSRLDLGKFKYGGPFTTEQVEDVKTFLRLLMVVFIACAMPSALLVVNRLRDHLDIALTKSNDVDTSTLKCYLNLLYDHEVFYIAVVLLPLHEFILRPILHKYFSWVQCYWIFSLGAILQFARLILLMAYMLIARHNFLTHNHDRNATIQCIFLEDYGTLSSTFDFRLMALPSFLNSISIITLGMGGVEFICAQTPYSMRGLISGAGYGSVALFTLIGIAVTQPFTMKLSVWNTRGIINCGFWYALLVTVFFTFNSIILYILGRVYKNRKREDVLPNEQIFAERYYAEPEHHEQKRTQYNGKHTHT